MSFVDRTIPSSIRYTGVFPDSGPAWMYILILKTWSDDVRTDAGLTDAERAFLITPDFDQCLQACFGTAEADDRDLDVDAGEVDLTCRFLYGTLRKR
jgi:hypothetical protein